MAKKTIQRDSEYQYLDDFFRDMGYTGGKITSRNPHYLTDCSSLERTEYCIERLHYVDDVGGDSHHPKHDDVCQAYYAEEKLIIEWGEGWKNVAEGTDPNVRWIHLGKFGGSWRYIGIYQYIKPSDLKKHEAKLTVGRRGNPRVYRMVEADLNLPKNYLPLTGEQIAELRRLRL